MEHYRRYLLSVVGVVVLLGLLTLSSVYGQVNNRFVDNLREPDAAGDDVTLCHVTGSETNPFEVKTIPEAAKEAHLKHGDIFPVPAGGCPAGGLGPTPVPGATPEPVTVLLFGTGLAAAGYAARRARRKKSESLDS